MIEVSEPRGLVANGVKWNRLVGLNCNESLLNCVAYEMSNISKGKLIHDVSTVGLHCLYFNPQLFRDLSVPATLSNELNNLYLTFCELPRADRRGD